MKIANYAATTAFDVGHQAEPTQGLRSRIANLVEQGVAAIQAAKASRRRAARLMNLDDRVLSDIGISEPEIRQLRARRLLLPPSWVD
jgi:uncharacterized protein YjiS (DUF1127 family)